MIRFSPVLNLKGESPWLLPIGFAVKIAVGLYFLYIYTEVYGKGTLSADAGAFMNESKVLNEVFYSSPKDYFKLLTGIGYDHDLILHYLSETSHWDAGAQAIISDNRNIIRIHSLIHFISFGNPTIHVIIMNLISVLAIKQFFLALKHRSQVKSHWVLISLLLLPSLLFWSSSILKEPLMLLGASILFRGFIGDLKLKKQIVFVLAGCILLFLFKPYVLIALFPVFIFLGFYQLIPKYKIIGSLIGIATLLTITTLTFSSTRKKVVHIFSKKQYDFKNVGKGGIHANTDSTFYFFQPDQIESLRITGDSVELIKPITATIIQHGSFEEPVPIDLVPTGNKWHIYFINTKSDGYIDVTMINDSFGQMILNIPEAITNTLFRPFPFDPGSWLKYPVMIESLLLYLFLTFSIIKRKQLSSEEKPILVSLIIFILTLSLFIGWVTPVIGAIVRYRILVSLAILIIGLILIKNPKKQSIS